MVASYHSSAGACRAIVAPPPPPNPQELLSVLADLYRAAHPVDDVLTRRVLRVATVLGRQVLGLHA